MLPANFCRGTVYNNSGLSVPSHVLPPALLFCSTDERRESVADLASSTVSMLGREEITLQHKAGQSDNSKALCI